MTIRFGILASIPLALVFCACFGAVASGTEKSRIDYRDSDLSNSDYLVTQLVNSNKLAGCAAASRSTTDPIVLMIGVDGMGSLSLVANRFGTSLKKEVGKTTIQINKIKINKAFVIDGSIMTVPLSKVEVAGVDKGISVNGVQVEGIREIYGLVMRCIRSSK